MSLIVLIIILLLLFGGGGYYGYRIGDRAAVLVLSARL